MIISLLEQKKMNKYDIEDWITFVKRLEEKNLKTPFHSFFLQFIDSSGTHVIHYVDSFEESKSAVIHQLNKILKYPQNYDDVIVYVNTKLCKY